MSRAATVRTAALRFFNEPPSRLFVIAVLTASMLISISCPNAASKSRNKTLLTSVTPIGSIMRNVVGDKFDVVSLTTPREIAEGRLRPPSNSEIAALSKTAAGAILFGTFDKDAVEVVSDTFSNSFSTWTLSDSMRSSQTFPWVDPIAAKEIAIRVVNIATQLVPSETEYFRRAAGEFSAALTRVDRVISDTASTIPADGRKLAATTESLRPFFERYGFSYYSIESEGGTSALAARMRSEGISVVYVNAFGSSHYGELAREVFEDSGARLQGDLFDARLPGPVGSQFHTYLGMLIENARQAFAPLGADVSRLDSLSPVDVAP
ncbi:MAG: hypothetical protein C4319_07230 [Acidimicrobiia bacterium]